MHLDFRRTVFATATGVTLVALLVVGLAMPSPSAVYRVQLFVMLGLAFLVATLLAGIVALALDARYKQRMRLIVQMARRYALGDLWRPGDDFGTDELGDATRALDAAALQLGRRFDSISRDRARMEAILGGMVEGVLAIDADGHVRLINDSARRLLGIVDDIGGRPLPDAPPLGAVAEAVTRVRGGGDAVSIEITLPGDVGRTMVAHVAPVITGGRGAVVVLHDITELRRADQMRRDFVANVSHELRTPLTSIRGYVEALQDGVADEGSRQHFLGVIARHAGRMEQLVSDLLRLARLDAGQETADLAPVSLSRVCATLSDDFAPIVAGKALTMRWQVPPDAELPLVSDAAKLHDILRNLIENAVTHTPTGGTVETVAERVDSDVRLRVRDTGPGVPEASLHRIFERFYRVDPSRQRPGGTGLGLAIVRHLVGVLGGQISVRNRPDGGAEFTVRLPIAPDRMRLS